MTAVLKVKTQNQLYKTGEFLHFKTTWIVL